MNFIIRLLLSPDINFIKVKKRVVKSLSTYNILLNSLLLWTKPYRYIDIYYLKLLQYLVGAVVRSFLENILPWPGVPPLLLGGRASCRALVELRAELNAELCAELNAELRAELRLELRAELRVEPCAGVQTCRCADVQTFVRAINCRDDCRDDCMGVRTGIRTGYCRAFLVY